MPGPACVRTHSVEEHAPCHFLNVKVELSFIRGRHESTRKAGNTAIPTTVTIDYSARVTRTNKRMRVCLFDCWFSCFRRNDAATSRMFCIWLLLFSLYCLFSKGVGIIILGPCPSQYTHTSIQLIHHPDSFAYGPIHNHVHTYICMSLCVCACIYMIGGARPSATFTSVRYMELP